MHLHEGRWIVLVDSDLWDVLTHLHEALVGVRLGKLWGTWLHLLNLPIDLGQDDLVKSGLVFCYLLSGLA